MKEPLEIICLLRTGLTSKPGPTLKPGLLSNSQNGLNKPISLDLSFINQVLQHLDGHPLDSLQYVNLSFPRTPKTRPSTPDVVSQMLHREE